MYLPMKTVGYFGSLLLCFIVTQNSVSISCLHLFLINDWMICIYATTKKKKPEHH